MTRELTIHTPGQGLHLITGQVSEVVAEAVAAAGETEGLCTIFLRHTSASLIIQENADPSAKRDLQTWLSRLVPESTSLYTHNDEGSDDMPAHIKAVLTATSLSIPILNGKLALGTWQGIYIWEHRRAPHERRVVVHIGP
jgi:secondary thiamine-phosphate synthase enzyme